MEIKPSEWQATRKSVWNKGVKERRGCGRGILSGCEEGAEDEILIQSCAEPARARCLQGRSICQLIPSSSTWLVLLRISK